MIKYGHDFDMRVLKYIHDHPEVKTNEIVAAANRSGLDVNYGNIYRSLMRLKKEKYAIIRYQMVDDGRVSTKRRKEIHCTISEQGKEALERYRNRAQQLELPLQMSIAPESQEQGQVHVTRRFGDIQITISGDLPITHRLYVTLEPIAQ